MGEEQCSRTLCCFWVPPRLFSTWFGWKMAFSESVHVGFRCNHWPIICLPLWIYRNKKRNRIKIIRIHVYRYTRNKIRIDIRALGLPHQRPIYLAKKTRQRFEDGPRGYAENVAWMELSLDPFSWYWCWLVGWKYHCWISGFNAKTDFNLNQNSMMGPKIPRDHAVLRSLGEASSIRHRLQSRTTK